MTTEEQYEQFVALSNAYYIARDNMRDKCKRVAIVLFGNRGLEYKFYFEPKQIEAVVFDYVDGYEEHVGFFSPALLSKTNEELLVIKDQMNDEALVEEIERELRLKALSEKIDKEVRYQIYLEVKEEMEK